MKDLSDKELIDTVCSLRSREKSLLLELLLCIGEVDEREIYRDEGYESLFAYMTGALGYSKAGAYRRIQVARLVRKFEGVYQALESDALSFSAACEISKVASESNIDVLVGECAGKSMIEVERVVASQGVVVPRKKESVRVVKTKSVKAAALELVSNSSSEIGSAAEQKVEECYRVALDVDGEFMELYAEVKALSGGNGMEGALKKVMREYLKRNSPKEREKRRVERATKSSSSSEKRTRHIPTQVKDQVYIRDRGRCTYESASGHRCGSTHQLEYDHVHPFGLGGEHTTENLRLRCRGHNRLEAERVYGREVMDGFR